MFKKVFRGIKDKVTDTLVDRQLKNLPPQQRDMIKNMVKKNPDLFKKIATEIEALKKKGMAEQHASMQVMMKYKVELQKLAR